MGANKKYFTELRDYFQQKYDFVEEEMIWETLKTEEEKNNEEV
tara:strand:- start:341 stop:469 length:129 start_codon:yes stop_codon:yes gene_type:complete